MDGLPDLSVAAIVGPTGSGKSELGVRLAEEFRGEVVNCDSLQLYRYLDIGTAKTLPGEQRGIPHHLLNVLNPDEVFTAGEYARRARPLLREISRRGSLPIVVGGTGFYLRALFEGLFPGPPRDEPTRERLALREAKRPGSLHRVLARLDPPAARRIHAGDIQKLIRALEVRLLTGRPLTEWFAAGREAMEGFRVIKIGLDPPRDALYQRLDARTVKMFENGLVEEVRRVLAVGFPQTSKALEAHGYRQALQVIRGELDPKQAIFYAQRNTRQYAKRQWTWFRREPGVLWIRGFGEDPIVTQSAVQFIRRFL